MPPWIRRVKWTPRKGKLRIGHRIDQVPHQLLALGADLVILAAEREDAHLALFAGEFGYAVAMQAGAVDQKVRGEFAGRGFDGPAAAARDHAIGARAGDHADTAIGEFGDQRGAHAGVIHDAFLGHAQRGHAAHVRFDLAHLLTLEPAQAFESVGGAALVQGAQALDFDFAGGDHELAADFVRDGVLLAERHHLADAGNGQPGFHGTRLVIEAAVQHAAVVAGLVASHARLLFQQGDARAGKSFTQLVGGGQAHDASADDGEAPGFGFFHPIPV